MLVIVGKATPNRETDEVELYLSQFGQVLASEKSFVYAWSFNPDDRAIDEIRETLEYEDDVYLYLPSDGERANLRMHIKDFRHNRNGINSCPVEWRQYCITELQGIQSWVHLWFLVDGIEELDRPVELLRDFVPIFKDKYRDWGQNYFAFLRNR